MSFTYNFNDNLIYNTKLAVVGSRNFNDYNQLKNTINNIRLSYPNINTIVSGGAIGADKLSEVYAHEFQLQTIIFQPEWNKYGKKAGILRNKDIICNADIVVAFWDGKSPGTKNSIELANVHQKKLFVVHF